MSKPKPRAATIRESPNYDRRKRHPASLCTGHSRQGRGRQSIKDLLARILHDSGEDESARALWESILEQEPGQPEATAALAAAIAAGPEPVESHAPTPRQRWLHGTMGMALMAIGIGIGLWAGHNPTSTPMPFLEIRLPASPTRTDFEALRTNFLAQVDENVQVVLSGGSGKNAHERRNRLWVLANALTEGYRCLTWDQIRIDFTPIFPYKKENIIYMVTRNKLVIHLLVY